MKTFTRKDIRNGWTATTNLDMPEAGERRFMQVRTSKRHDGSLTTTASVNQRNEDGSGYIHAVFLDFYKTVATEKVRCTEKAVTEQHAKVLEQIEQIKQRAADHYGEAVAA